MDVTRLVMVAFQLSLIAVMFSYGLRADADDLLDLLRRPVLLMRSLIAVVVVMPAVAVALARWFDFRPTVEIALVALAISPLAPLLPAREVKAGGAAKYGLALVVVLAALSIGLIPLAAQLLGVVFGRNYVVTPWSVAVIMLTTVLLPLTAGLITRRIARGFAERIAAPVALAQKVLLPLAVTVLAISAGPAIWQLVGNGTVIVIAIFVGIGFSVGHVLGGPDPRNATDLAFSTACRHPATALAIATANYPDQNFQAAVLLYAVVGVIFGLSYSIWRRRAVPWRPKRPLGGLRHRKL